jgi:dihydrofolate reductase
MAAKLSIIVCIADNRGIGFENKLLFRIPNDLEHFKQKTLGHVLIMGQKTFQSIGKALPGRTTIIVSNDRDFKAGNVKILYSLEDAILEARNIESDEIYICGGGSIYKQTINLADKLYLTLVSSSPQADVFFPEYPQFSKVVYESSVMEYNDLKYRFLELEKGEKVHI